MIPIFPEFHKLELSHKAEVENIAHLFEPYSDFNFENMWAWDTNESIKISLLNNNLVVMTKNIFTDEINCTYLGNNHLDDTLHKLFNYLKNMGIQNPNICSVPEASLKNLNFKKYFIGFDINSCDYIYDLSQLSSYAGNKFMQKRGRKNNFVKNHPNASVKVINLLDEGSKKEIISLNNSWVQSKSIYQADMDVTKEVIAINRFLNANFKDAYCVGLYEEKLIGYAIFSFHKNDFCINHFIKADISYIGVYEFFIQECSRLLKDLGCTYLNYLEDMGLPGLRQAKLTYRPIKFLRKYTVKEL